MAMSKAKRRRLKHKADCVPRSAVHPRPGNRPHYIPPNCPECGTPLVLSDLFANPNCPKDEIWYDEWMCPNCRDGDYLDWPEEQWLASEERSKVFEGITIEIPEDVVDKLERANRLKKIVNAQGYPPRVLYNLR